jgi:predicted nucleic acid-binding protein
LIVIDASILANAIADDGKDGDQARSELRAAAVLAAPDLIDVETAAVFRKRWLAGGLSEERFASAVDDLSDLDLDRYPTLALMRRAYELRANVSTYDAAYVALAELLGCELLTGDRRLANATGPNCKIRLLRSSAGPRNIGTKQPNS